MKRLLLLFWILLISGCAGGNGVDLNSSVMSKSSHSASTSSEAASNVEVASEPATLTASTSSKTTTFSSKPSIATSSSSSSKAAVIMFSSSESATLTASTSSKTTTFSSSESAKASTSASSKASTFSSSELSIATVSSSSSKAAGASSSEPAVSTSSSSNTKNKTCVTYEDDRFKLPDHTQHIYHFTTDVNDNQDDAAALNTLIETAESNSTIMLPQGILDIFEPIRIYRSDITIIGNNTTLLSHITGKDEDTSVIDIRGIKHQTIGTTASAMFNQKQLHVNVNRTLANGEILLLEQPNDKTYVHELLGSKVWYEKLPTLRSEIVEVTHDDNGLLTLAHQSTALIDPSADIYPLSTIHHVIIKNLTIDATHKSDPYDYIYENSEPNLMVNSIKAYYASYLMIENVTLNNSGKHPLVFERCYQCYGQNIAIDGAINKGIDGNGYLRFNKSFHSHLKNVSVKHIRHIVFQWASAHNSIEGLYSEVDVNFHGGGSHDNCVLDAQMNVDIEKHHWGKLYITPNDAHWAPPDFDSNFVEEH